MAKNPEPSVRSLSLDSLVAEGINKKIQISTESIRQIPDAQITETVGIIRENFNLEDNATAFYGMATLLQKGGCNSNKNTNIIIDIAGKKMESKVVATLIRQKCKNASPRQFARQIADQIFAVSKNANIPGNLKIRLEKQYTKQWNEIQNPDKDYWASDFQSSNPNCPDGIKFLIRQNYQDTFSKRN